MPQIRSYPQADTIEDTDAFAIDRVGTGTMWIEAEDFLPPALTPGVYGDATHVAQVTVDAGGQISDLADVAITYPAAVAQVSGPTLIVYEGGAALATGIKGDLSIPFDCTINGWTLLADQSGSCVVDIWKAPVGSYPPTIANTITASALPTIAAAQSAHSSTLTGWTTSITAGDTLRFNINSNSAITRLTIALKVTRP